MTVQAERVNGQSTGVHWPLGWGHDPSFHLEMFSCYFFSLVDVCLYTGQAIIGTKRGMYFYLLFFQGKGTWCMWIIWVLMFEKKNQRKFRTFCCRMSKCLIYVIWTIPYLFRPEPNAFLHYSYSKIFCNSTLYVPLIQVWMGEEERMMKMPMMKKLFVGMSLYRILLYTGKLCHFCRTCSTSYQSGVS